jgi:thioredoxin-like negative regulator of GroEL
VQELQKEMPESFAYKEVDVYEDARAAMEFGIQSTPTIAVVSAGGKVTGQVAGVPTIEELRSMIRKALTP